MAKDNNSGLKYVMVQSFYGQVMLAMIKKCGKDKKVSESETKNLGTKNKSAVFLKCF